MNWLDITIISIIVLFTLMGISRGLVSQVFSITALLGGIITGFIFYDLLGAVFIKEGLVENESIANVGGFIILAFVSYVIIQLIGWLITKLIGTLKLGWLNRLCGGLLGAVIGLITAFLLTSSLSMFYSQNDPAFKNSTLVPYLDETFMIAKQTLPENFEESFKNARDLVREEGLKAAMKIKDSEKVKEILKDKETQREKPE